MQGEVQHTGAAGSYDVPEGTDIAKVAAALFPSTPDRTAVLHVRRGRGQALRRTASAVLPVDDDTDELELPFSSGWDLASEVASYGPDVVVVSPEDLRDQVVARLEAALEDAS